MRIEGITGNPIVVPLDKIPLLSYEEFRSQAGMLMREEGSHCVAYYAIPDGGKLRFYCCIASDSEHKIVLLSHEQKTSASISLDSLMLIHPSFHIYEREIHEQFGVEFPGHPWLKPVRLHGKTEGKKNDLLQSGSYPFYEIGGGELHEVGVGPVHAGVIEPGYFRFLCNGEKVLHLEIQLGYQHRGIETLFLEKISGIQRAVLAENIAGDTAVGHSIAHAQLVEALFQNPGISSGIMNARSVALEMERLAVHIGDTAALCTDIAYQFGQVVNEALRTMVINTTQDWCGNRFGKGLIRPGGTHYPLTKEIAGRILSVISEVEERYRQITGEMFTNPSVLGRFEGTGRVTAQQATQIGAVGMAAKSSGVKRDIRWSHPFQAYRNVPVTPEVIPGGDVWARAMLRKREALQSVALIRELLKNNIDSQDGAAPVYDSTFLPSCFVLSMTEGWRGEIVHSAVTNEEGKIIHYKIKDPSFNNWMALALAVRNQEISDFPLCNKSYNLSYCGHDL
jgi:Ni,Fe-hydrogenase III large subunit